jgi:hypothetical protein
MLPRLTPALLALAASLLATCAPLPPAPSPFPVPNQRAAAPSPPPGASTPAAARADPPPASSEQCPRLRTDLPELIRADFDVPVPEIVEPTGKVMAPLHERLAALLRGKAAGHVRIGMYGDSNMTRDYITGEMRRTLQARHGDAGHGFVSLGQPWNWYLHQDVRHGVDKDGWKPIAMSTHQVIDRLYGFAGIAAQSQRPRAVSWVATAPDPSPVGRAVSRVDTYFLKRPGSGTFEIRVDGAPHAMVDTSSSQVEAGFHLIELPDGPHRVDFVSGPKSVRLFGVTLERTVPGVVVDSIGIGGVNAELLAKGDPDIAKATLRRRRYDLVIFLTGATEPDTPAQLVAMKKLVDLHREALPGVAILIMSPPDLAGGPSERPTRNPRIDRLTRMKREAAEQTGSAFWDFRAAMGGELSVIQFVKHGMAWNDYIHLTDKGGAYMGRRVAYALLRDLAGYLEKHPDAGCAPDRAERAPSR